MPLDNVPLTAQQDQQDDPFVLKYTLEVNTKDTYILDISTSYRIEMEF